MLTAKEIKECESKRAIKVLVIENTPEDWRLWNAFTQFLSYNNDITMKVYVTLLEENRKMSTRDLASTANVSLYNAERVLKALYDLNLVSQETSKKGFYEVDYWNIKTRISGVLRIIPETYFKESQLKSENKPKSKQNFAEISITDTK